MIPSFASKLSLNAKLKAEANSSVKLPSTIHLLDLVVTADKSPYCRYLSVS